MTRVIAVQEKNDENQNCLLFALINVGMANAAISSWGTKFRDDLWRPELGIKYHPYKVEEDKVMILPDLNWKKLGASRTNAAKYNEKNFDPPFPAYTSGHATFCCVVFQMIANFYQTYDISFNYTSPEWNGDSVDEFNRTRACIIHEISSLVDGMAECSASRTFNGVHYAFDSVTGCAVGMDIANYVFETMYTPKKGSRQKVMTTNAVPTRIAEYLANTPTSGYEPVLCDEIPSYPIHSSD